MKVDVLKFVCIFSTLLIIVIVSPLGEVIVNDISNHAISNELILESFIILLAGIVYYRLYS